MREWLGMDGGEGSRTHRPATHGLRPFLSILSIITATTHSKCISISRTLRPSIPRASYPSHEHHLHDHLLILFNPTITPSNIANIVSIIYTSCSSNCALDLLLSRWRLSALNISLAVYPCSYCRFAQMHLCPSRSLHGEGVIL